MTFAIVGLAHALQFVAIPWAPTLDTVTTAGGWLIVGREKSSFGIGSLGISPLIGAVQLIGIVLAIVPRLRRSIAQRASEAGPLRIAFGMSIGLAVFQASGMFMFLQSLTQDFTISPLSIWVTCVTLALGAVLYTALAYALQRWGLGRGLAGATLFYGLLTIVSIVHALIFDWLSYHETAAQGLDLGLLVLVIAATLLATRASLGDAPLLPDDSRLARVSGGFTIALACVAMLKVPFAFATLPGFAWVTNGALWLAVTVAVGLWLAYQASQPSESPESSRAARDQLFALGKSLALVIVGLAILTASATGTVIKGWAEIVVATIVTYSEWRRTEQRADKTTWHGTDSSSASD